MTTGGRGDPAAESADKADALGQKAEGGQRPAGAKKATARKMSSAASPKRRAPVRASYPKRAGSGSSTPRRAHGGSPPAVHVRPEDVRLLQGRGSRGRGGGPGGSYWHVHVGEQRVGHVYVNVIDTEPVGRHASIQIQLNVGAQGRGIGRIAYRLASEQSGHDVVYAHMRKSNAASRRAAEHAGFRVVENPQVTQLLMRWTRPNS